MKKMNSKFLGLIILVALFSSCDKTDLTEMANESKPKNNVDVKVPVTPYTNFRLKTITDPLKHTSTELTYNADNKVTTMALYNTLNGAHNLISTTTYSYSSRGELGKETYVEAAHPKKSSVYEYKYLNGKFLTSTLSYMDNTNPSSPVVEDFYAYEYTYDGKNMTKLVEKNEQGNVNYVDDYAFSVVNGETNIAETYTYTGTAPMFSLEVDYANVLDPLYFLPGNPFQSEYLIKSRVYNPSVSENFTQSYTLDAGGKIVTVSKTFANKPAANVTVSYTYEAKTL